jgi:hypothetical protein
LLLAVAPVVLITMVEVEAPVDLQLIMVVRHLQLPLDQEHML